MTKLTGKAKARARKKALQIKPQEVELQTYTQNNKKGFRPDAGLNSQEGTNYYWFQVAEFVAANSKLESLGRSGVRSFKENGKTTFEINAEVDIMDKEGVEHLAPKKDNGYFATFRLTPEQFTQMAEQIDKGAMAVRVQGVPGKHEVSNIGEKYRIIDVESTWSQGNHRGQMRYMIATDKGMIDMDSNQLSRNLRRVVADAVA